MGSLSLLLLPFLGPWAAVPLGDVTLGFVHFVEFGNIGSHVAEVEDHDENEEDWTDGSVGFAMVWRTVMRLSVEFMFTASSLVMSSLEALVMSAASVVLSTEHTHESWLLVALVILILFLAKVTARENSGRKLLGNIDGFASRFNSCALAPRASISIACIFICIFASIFKRFTSHESCPLVDDTVMHFLVVMSWLWSFFLCVAGKHCRWEFSSIIHGEAAAWDSGASAPDAFWISVALTFDAVGGLALL